ncbi:S-type pyocin domain-containing protein [Pseudomonas sp. Pseusp122]|uniref:S-type pyocin domain-containing protein n=1 Tax=unclassified Pseudomonas TaxID=196821 RepID=UPI0039A6AD8F
MSSNGSNGPIELPPTVITPGPDKPSSSGRPGGGGCGGGGGGDVSFGGPPGSGGSDENEQAAREQEEEKARADAEARARAEAQARAEAAARAQAEREQAIIRHGQRVESLTGSFQSQKIELEQRYAAKSADLPRAIQSEINLAVAPLNSPVSSEEQLAHIVRQKAHINYLINSRRDELGRSNSIAQAFNGGDPVLQSAQQYKNHLEAHSNVDSNNAQQLHQSWLESATHAHEAKLLAEALALLESQSAKLSAQHAQLAAKMAEEGAASTPSQRPAADATRLWAVVAPSAAAPATAGMGSVWRLASQIARQQFLRSATRALSRSPLMLAAYSPKLADAELPPPVLGVPLAQLDLPDGLDLEFVANRNGSVDVPHRLHLGEDGTAEWVAADGVEVGSKVRVRSFTWNAENNTYEFIRDGETEPALVWTPIARPQDSSTSTPTQAPQLPVDPGVSVSPVVPELEVYPEVVRGFDDYILISPPGSGLPNSYLLFNTPRNTPGIASGYGKPVSGTWLGDNLSKEGAAIPSQIADQLRGQRFSTFDRQREAIWRAVARDPELSKQFSALSLEEMNNGNAPYAPETTWVGGRKKFEIHHKDWIKNGGPVYDMDNFVVLPPKHHIDTHQKEK